MGSQLAYRDTEVDSMRDVNAYSGWQQTMHTFFGFLFFMRNFIELKKFETTIGYISGEGVANTMKRIK